MSDMFSIVINLTKISNWDVSNVTNMSDMFSNCYKFNQDILNWDVSNTNMNFMFYFCWNFNQSIMMLVMLLI